MAIKVSATSIMFLLITVSMISRASILLPFYSGQRPKTTGAAIPLRRSRQSTQFIVCGLNPTPFEMICQTSLSDLTFREKGLGFSLHILATYSRCRDGLNSFFHEIHWPSRLKAPPISPLAAARNLSAGKGLSSSFMCINYGTKSINFKKFCQSSLSPSLSGSTHCTN
jgi:hypothetical protein